MPSASRPMSGVGPVLTAGLPPHTVPPQCPVGGASPTTIICCDISTTCTERIVSSTPPFRAAHRQDATHFIGQRLVLVEHDATVQKRLAKRRHVAEVDGGAEDDSRDRGRGELRHQGGEVIAFARLQGNPGRHFAGNPPPRQFDEFDFDSPVNRPDRVEADAQAARWSCPYAGCNRSEDLMECGCAACAWPGAAAMAPPLPSTAAVQHFREIHGGSGPMA